MNHLPGLRTPLHFYYLSTYVYVGRKDETFCNRECKSEYVVSEFYAVASCCDVSTYFYTCTAVSRATYSHSLMEVRPS
jgi:hypothetical protein